MVVMADPVDSERRPVFEEGKLGTERIVDVVILTYNEEQHIVRAIRSVSGFARQVFVVDSHSPDRTVELAESLGAHVVRHEFINQAKQFNWALETLPIAAPWVMRLDADEIVEGELAAEILQELPRVADTVAGINLRRKHIFMGRWVRHGGRFPLILLRIWRRGQGRVENRWMDEHVYVWGGGTITFRGTFSDHNLGDLSHFTDKHNRYATREAIEVLNQRRKLLPRDEELTARSSSFQASIKRVGKEWIYNRLPFPVSSSLYFLWRYFLQLGFLDGRSGLVYHALQGFWYRFLVGAKVMELEMATRHLSDAGQVRAEIQRLTGFRLE